MVSLKSQWVVTAVLAIVAVVAVMVWRSSDVGKGASSSSASAPVQKPAGGQAATAQIEVLPAKAATTGGAFVPVLSSSLSDSPIKVKEGAAVKP